ncbi:Protein of unknown function [Pyronema omphalodes CBS 100304]|uniref:Uncharacterized protein n=1 Tax=Pyronema omphalodes (strain CBS 100304) TaxID=1076935 RepID=U4LAD3_PYROM|nr:Protein of unknown function [Pyronema omphalodes CBS 100304]
MHTAIPTPMYPTICPFYLNDFTLEYLLNNKIFDYIEYNLSYNPWLHQPDQQASFHHPNPQPYHLECHIPDTNVNIQPSLHITICG